MEVRIEVQVYFVHVSQRSVSSDNLQKLLSLSNVYQRALVHAEGLQVSHMRNDKCENICSEEWDTMELQMLEIIAPIEHRNACFESVSPSEVTFEGTSLHIVLRCFN